MLRVLLVASVLSSGVVLCTRSIAAGSMDLAGIYPFRFGMTRQKTLKIARSILRHAKPLESEGGHVIRPEQTLVSESQPGPITFDLVIDRVPFDVALYFSKPKDLLKGATLVPLRERLVNGRESCEGALRGLAGRISDADNQKIGGPYLRVPQAGVIEVYYSDSDSRVNRLAYMEWRSATTMCDIFIVYTPAYAWTLLH